LPFCFCDANQLETALLNLVINARDAMNEVGLLKIETGYIVFDDFAAQMRGIAKGSYVVLAVIDAGDGMPPETVARAFEPFFTTKPRGKGTGLGLSMVYGFVKQSKGHVEIDSALGRGTTVRIYLPSLATGDTPALAEDENMASVARNAYGRREAILLVEHDAEVRLYTAETLRNLNYRVIDVETAEAALDILAQSNPELDLLLTDIVLPGGLAGDELAIRATVARPGIKVLLMTGYSQDVVVRQSRLDPDTGVIEKPFTRETLAACVVRTLAAGETLPNESTRHGPPPLSFSVQ
jgi:CheY-like chemotaxis protein